MTSKFLIQSIPHSGTRFTSALFYALGFTDADYEVRHFNDELPKHHYVVIPLRDPCLTAISNERGAQFGEIENRHGVPLELVNKMYDIFIKQSFKRKFIYFDIECPPEKRKSHIISILKQLDLYDDEQLPIIKSYAEKWRPIGVNDNEWKSAYVERGEFPSSVRRCDIQRALNWHNKVKQECIYDYIA
jgi:hypothetical protein